MDKWAALRNVKAWLKDTMLEEGEEFAVFPEHNHLTIRILNMDKRLYRDEIAKEQKAKGGLKWNH